MQTRAAIDSLMAGVSTNFNDGVESRRRPSPPVPSINPLQTELPISSCIPHGGEGGIRTLEHLLGCYSLSRRAPSTTRPPLLQPKSAQAQQREGLTRALQALALRARCARPKSLLRFCRTLEHLLGCYSLSRRAPSTTRPSLHAAARVPEATLAIKSGCAEAGT